MGAKLLRKPSAFLPVLMSFTAATIVLFWAVRFGVARQPDEGAAAHLWQLLMAGQVPLIGFFAIRWVRAEPKRGLFVLAVQFGAALAAMIPVFALRW